MCLELNEVTADYTDDDTTSRSDILRGVGIAEVKTLVFIPPAEPPRRYYYYYKQATHHPVYKRDGFRSLVALPQITESCENLNSLVVAGALKHI